MRVAIAGFSLESVSFLPQAMSLETFRRAECAGGDIVDRFRGTNKVMGGFLDVLEGAGASVVPLVHTEGGAAGPSSDEAFVHYADRICAGLAAAGPLDGVLLDLHGALTTPTRLDPDREIVERVRAVVGRKVPVMVAFDYHGNLDRSTLEVADALTGYHYSPHVDMGETGARAARLMVRRIAGEIDPVTAIVKPGIMVPSIFSATALRPLADIVAESIAMAGKGPLLDVSVFAGFSYADVPNCGFSVVAVADRDRSAASHAARALAERLRAERHRLYHDDLVFGLADGVAEAVRRAASSSRPIVLLEHADRMNDSTHVLRELLRQRVARAAVPYLCDPEAARAAMAAGAGAHVRLAVGGRSSDRAGGPVEIEGTVRWAGEKRYRVTGPMARGAPVDLGPTAVIDAGGVVVTVTTAQRTAVDEDCFGQFGMDARDFPIIVLRSKTHFRAVYEPLAEAILIVDTPDWGPADLTTLPYRHVPTDRVFPFVDRE